MFKRTKSYLLLTLLVLTGFAGKIHSDTLTGKERRQLLKELKISKSDVSESIEGLSEKQFHFTSDKNGLSVKDCIFQLAAMQNKLWTGTQLMMRDQDVAPHKRKVDPAMVSLAASLSGNKTERFGNNQSFPGINEALEQFRSDRLSIVKYIKTTTDDLHKYRVSTTSGEFDVYQLMQLQTKYTTATAELIESIKRSPGFPR